VSSQSRPRRVAGIAALGAGAIGATVAAGWAAQRRLVARSSADADDIAKAGLDLPDGLEHTVVDVDDGGRIHVVSKGSGQPLVLLHGVFLNSGIWVHQLADLSDEYRVIALDLRGHGRSVLGADGFGSDVVPEAGGHSSTVADPVGELLLAQNAESKASQLAPDSPDGSTRKGNPGRRRRFPIPRFGTSLLGPRRPAPMALERLARDVREVLTALDVEDGILVGHSMGGMVAIQAIAGLSPEERHRRLSGVMLTSTTTGPIFGLPGWDLIASVGSSTALRIVGASVRAGRGPIPKGDMRWWASRLSFGADAPAAQVRFVEAMLAETDPRTMNGLLEALARVNLTALLPSVDLPTLVTVGTHDRLTPPWHARRLENRLPDGRLVELARCGHMPMIERPKEFDRLLEEHARKVS
jgi:pimeloyl-ACP methyl ester carboxylesterase